MRIFSIRPEQRGSVNLADCSQFDLGGHARFAPFAAVCPFLIIHTYEVSKVTLHVQPVHILSAELLQHLSRLQVSLPS